MMERMFDLDIFLREEMRPSKEPLVVKPIITTP
jgi:hypothetical protein